VRANRIASVLSVLAILLLWVAFTNSSLPLPKAKGPYQGQFSFTYTSTLENGDTDDAEVTLLVHQEDIQLTKDADGKPNKIPPNEFGKSDGAKITHYNGKAINPGEQVLLKEGKLALTPKGGVFFEPATGFRMARLYLPAPEVTSNRFLELNADGYRNFTLLEHTWASLQRVLLGRYHRWR